MITNTMHSLFNKEIKMASSTVNHKLVLTWGESIMYPCFIDYDMMMIERCVTYKHFFLFIAKKKKTSSESVMVCHAISCYFVCLFVVMVKSYVSLVPFAFHRTFRAKISC